MDIVISKALDWCISHQVPFCAFREPDSDIINFYSSPAASEPGRKPATDADYFFIGAFNEPLAQARIIPFEMDAAKTLTTLPIPAEAQASEIKEVSTCREDYLQGVSNLISDLKDRGEAKTVISRVQVTQGRFDPVKAFASLMDGARHLFCSCFYHPCIGFWIGATPELLLDCDLGHGTFRTVALAGTKAADQEWDDKNRREQALVSQYVSGVLDRLGLAYERSATHDLSFNSLRHLVTEFNGGLGCADPASIIDALNPTPALCGYPKEVALADIARIEKSPRGFYGGIIGFKQGQRLRAYVNIRCLNFTQNAYAIRAGGGILAESDAEAEWEETRNKMASLKSLLRID